MDSQVPAPRQRGAAAIFSPSVLAALLAATYLVVHIAYLPPNPTGVDSVNFVLGVRHFDVADHRPHPPGYPVFIALAKSSAGVIAWFQPSGPVNSTRLDTQAVAMWSAVFGAIGVLVLRRLFIELGAADDRAVAAAALTMACPLFWFSGIRAMSDVSGLTAAVTAQALTLSAYRRANKGDHGALTRLVLAGLISGIGIGLRSQVIWLTLPILAVVTTSLARREAARTLLSVLGAWLGGVSLWAIPTVFSNGGPATYAAAISKQAAEDVASGTMLAVDQQLPALQDAIVRSVANPWGQKYLAAVILVLALTGAVRLLVRSPRPALFLTAGFGPYLIYHLLFQDSTHVRYGLPLVPAVAYLTVRGLDGTPRALHHSVTIGLVLACLAVGVPQAARHAKTGSPSLRALDDVRARLSQTDRRPVLAMHHAVSRILRIEELPARTLNAPPGLEWLELVKYWRDGGNTPVWFLAERERSDLALIDPRARRLIKRYRVAVDQRFLLAGVRPSGVDAYEIDRPGWFAGEGWALTPETAGVAARLQRGPGYGPVDAYVRRRVEPAVMMVGGRHLDANAAPAQFELSVDEQLIEQWMVRPGESFLRVTPLRSDILRPREDPHGRRPVDFARLQIRSAAADGSGAHVRTSIEQFDVQSADHVVFGFADGWFEQEYDPRAVRLWRWIGPRAVVQVHDGGRDLVLEAFGDAPAKQLGGEATLIVRAGDQVIGSHQLSGKFNLEMRIPAAALARAGGRLTLESDRSFIPHPTRDRRTLALRFFKLQLEALPSPKN